MIPVEVTQYLLTGFTGIHFYVVKDVSLRNFDV